MTTEVRCESCGELAPPGATWCEACGHELGVTPPVRCVACGELQVDELGYCLSCGHRQPRPGDHVEIDLGALVAVSDRGRRHQHNEDAVALAHISGSGSGINNGSDDGVEGDGAVEPYVVLVVCDGVSSTDRSADASQAAADAARDYLAEALQEVDAEPRTALVVAVERAQAAAAACLDPNVEQDLNGAPSTTLVASVLRGSTATTAWVGDSRAYWLGTETQKLTGLDHEIRGSLVKWLGADSVDPAPEITETEIQGLGWIVVCSDGLWRYASEPEDLAALVESLLGDSGQPSSDLVGGPLALARGLVEHANEAGGHDNISVALYSRRSAEAKEKSAEATQKPSTGESES